MRGVPPLYILRHGQTAWNAVGRLQGRFDAPLTERGRKQALAQCRILTGQNLVEYKALVSPQARARRTAALALPKGVAMRIDPALREVGLGDWSGLARADLLAETGAEDGYALYDLAPGGEGLDVLRRRCIRFLRVLSGPSIIVTHGITSRMLRLILTDTPTSALREIGGGQGMVYFVNRGRQVPLFASGQGLQPTKPLRY